MPEATFTHPDRTQYWTQAVSQQVPEAQALVVEPQVSGALEHETPDNITSLMEQAAKEALRQKLAEALPQQISYSVVKSQVEETQTLPEVLDITTLDHSAVRFIKSNWNAEEIIKHLPTKMALTDSSEAALELIGFLFASTGSEEVKKRVLAPISFHKCLYFHHHFITPFFTNLSASELQQCLPMFIQIPNISLAGSNLIRWLLEQRPEIDLLHRLPATIVFSQLKSTDIATLQLFIDRNHAEYLASLIVMNLDEQNLHQLHYTFLAALYSKLPNSRKKLIPRPVVRGDILFKMSPLLLEQHNHDWVQFIDSLPADITWKHLALISPKLLAELCAHCDSAKLIDRFVDSIDLQTLSFNEASFLNLLVNSETLSSLLDRLQPVNFQSTNSPGWDFLYACTDHGPPTSLVRFLPATIEYQTLSSQANRFLEDVLNEYTVNDILDRLPATIDLQQITGIAHFLMKLCTFAPGEMIKRLNLDDHPATEQSAQLLAKLKLAVSDSKIDKELPLTFDLSSNDPIITAYYLTLCKENTTTIITHLPDHIDFSSVGLLGEKLIDVLATNGAGEVIIERIVAPISLDNLSDKQLLILSDLVTSNSAAKLLDSLVKPINLQHASEYLLPLMNALLEHVNLQQALSLITNNLDLHDINVNGQKFLISMIIRFGYTAEIEEMIKHAASSLRRPINVDEWPTQRGYGPSLHEQITAFPVIRGSGKRLGDTGWYKAKVNKGYPETIIYLNTNTTLPQIFFQTVDYSQLSLKTYKAASALLGSYVNGANYPELHPDDDPYFQVSRTGYREVYAGPSVKSMQIDQLPTELAAEIQAQMGYILLQLEAHHIKHAHSHDRNFNVRFALTNGSEITAVLFDLNYAVIKAKQDSCSIIPIVSLRDWDLASS